MEIRQLKTFVSVWELKSFSKAAKKLFLTQSSVSTQIKGLEDELNCKLFIRTTKELNITSQGKILYKYAKNILRLEEAAKEEVKPENKEFIHLATSSIPSAHILPEVISEYRKFYPNINFEIEVDSSEHTIVNILDGAMEIGLIGKKINNKRLICEEFYSDEIVVITPNNKYYQKLKEENVNFERLIKEPLILRENGSGTLNAIENIFKEKQLKKDDLKIIARVNDTQTIKNMVINGLGISLISSLAVSELVRDNKILTFNINKIKERKFYIIYLKNNQINDVGKKFINYLKSI